MPFSILNGLSALGSGVAQFAGTAGLDLQKAQLANQSAILADQLATTRETALEGQRQTFQTGLEGQRQTFQAGQTAQTIAAENARNAATIAAGLQRTGMESASAMEREQARIHAPTELQKTMEYLGLNPDGSPKATGVGAGASAPAPSAAVSGGTGTQAATGTIAPDTSAAGAATDTGPVPSPRIDPLQNPIVRKALGQPAIGSEDDVRRAVTMDVRNDPNWSDKSQGQQYGEVERRLAIAKGTQPAPGNMATNAAMIASYQQKPLEERAMLMSGGSDIMAQVYKLNPNYQPSRFNQINDVMKRFGAEKEGDQVRYLDVAVQHMSVFDQAAQALASGNIPKLNALSNYFQTNFGVSAPTTLDGLKQIVTGEIQRAATGGIGAESDRTNLQKSLDAARSPQQLQDMTNGFRSLLTGQLRGLKRQYESGTGFKDDSPFSFNNKLDPETIRVLNPSAPAGAATAPPPPADPAAREIGKTYTSSTGQRGIWRGTGWEPVQ